MKAQHTRSGGGEDGYFNVGTVFATDAEASADRPVGDAGGVREMEREGFGAGVWGV